MSARPGLGRSPASRRSGWGPAAKAGRPGPSEGWIRGGGVCLGVGIGWEGGEGPEPAWGGGGGWREVWIRSEEVPGWGLWDEGPECGEVWTRGFGE